MIDAAGPAGRSWRRLAAPAEKAAAGGRAGYAGSASTAAADVPNDLAFLVGLRRRIKLDGIGPRGVAVVGSTVYVAEYFTDTLAVVDLESQGRPSR